MTDVRTVLVTAPDEKTGRELARTLVGERLAACGNVIPGVTSVYWWEDELEEASEVLLILKTTRERVETLVKRVSEIHPYDVPEVLALRVERGLEAYLSWVREESRTP